MPQTEETVDTRLARYLLGALERIAALPNAGPANEAARSAVAEARRLRTYLESEAKREIHYVTEAVSGLLQAGPLSDADAAALGLGTVHDEELELSPLGRAVMLELVARRHPDLRIVGAA